MKNKKIILFLSLIIILIINIITFYPYHPFELRFIDKLQGSEAKNNITIILIDQKSIEELGDFPWDRKIYVDLIKNIDAKIIAFDIGFFTKKKNDNILQKAINKAKEKNKIIILTEYFNKNKLIKPIFNATRGFSNLYIDSDGSLRKAVFFKNNEPSFALVIANSFIKSSSTKKIEKKLIIDKNKLNKSLIKYYNDFKEISFVDVLKNNKSIKSDIVLIGASTLNDNYKTPVDIYMPGVLVHANIVEMILNNDILLFVNNKINYLLFFLALIIGSFTSFLFLKKNKIFIILIIIIPIIYSWFFVKSFNNNKIISFAFVLINFFLGFLTYFFYWAFKEYKERKFIKNLFDKYLSPELVEELIKEKNRIINEEKEITVLFCDIRNFTSFSEKKKPEELFKIINYYLKKSSSIIIANKGFINKYLGDGIMAFWNAPKEIENEKELAAKSAIEIIKTLKKDNLLKNINLGIGIHSGKAFVGILGNEHLEYTAIGDTINTASRLESLTKKYGVNIIISEKIANNITFQKRLLDKVIVKGKNKPIKIYELQIKNNKRIKEINKNYEKGLNYYFKGEFKKAINYFSKNKDDKPSILMRERAKRLDKEKIKNWNGVWKFKEK